MSDLSPEQKRTGFGWSRVLPSLAWGTESAALRHAILRERCFDGDGMRWTDALVARTRRHVGGCISAVEIELRMELSTLFPAGADLAAILPNGYCWKALLASPLALDPTLLSHFRDRAAIGLMQQDSFLEAAAEESEPANVPFPSQVADALSTLLLAQAGWGDAGPDDLPMRADLPAEVLPELIWTVGAIFADALIRTGILPEADILILTDRAGADLIARHDEQTTPIALAALLAHRLRSTHIDATQFVYLARNRHIMALLAILADRTSIDFATLVRAIIEGDEKLLFGLCRAADFPREVAVRLVLGRRSVARGVDDSMLVEYADEYETMPQGSTAAIIAALGVAESLRIKLAQYRDRQGHDGH